MSEGVGSEILHMEQYSVIRLRSEREERNDPEKAVLLVLVLWRSVLFGLNVDTE